MLKHKYILRSNILLLCILLMSLFSTRVFADNWIDIDNETTDILSEDGAYMFRIIPQSGSENAHRQGMCRGILYAKKGETLSIQWERFLLNDICPMRAYVSNSGEYVVTVGEWHEYEKLPIVMYGEKGKLINVYGKLYQIIDPYRCFPEEMFSLSGRDWLSHSLMFFEHNDEYLVVRLRSKDILMFETSTGQLIDDRWKEINYFVSPDKFKQYSVLRLNIEEIIISKALKLASSDLKEERENGLFILNQCRDHVSIHVLEKALRDSTSKTINTHQGQLREYPIRKVARETLKAMGENVSENVVTEEKVEAKE